MSKKVEIPHPFVKWVGGKDKLLGEIIKRMPEGPFDYYEPFVGGGAVFFALAKLGRIRRANLNDACPEQMTAFSVIRDDPHELMPMLDELQKHAKDAAFFYKLRNEADQNKMSHAQIAARHIYLNKTCFNGLFRVNRAGRFNVPFGRYANPKLYDRDNLLACSAALASARLFVGDFEDVFKDAPIGPYSTVVYFDPPYIPVSATSDFDGYRSGGFSLDDQKRLARLFGKLVEQGALCIASNSPPARALYVGHGYTIDTVRAPRAINSDGSKRGNVDELLIVGRRSK